MEKINLDQVVTMMDEALAKPIGSAKDLKAGDNVMYKDGTDCAGMVGYIVQIRPESGKVDLKFGKATRMDVDVSQLLLLSDDHSIAPAKAAAAQ